jgi:hypothetical protein
MEVKDDIKNYKIVGYRILFLLWIVCCGLFAWLSFKVISLVSRKPDLWYLVLFTIPLMLYSLASYFFMLARFRLYLSPDGITFQFWAITLFSKWEGVERIQKGFLSTQIIVRNPNIEKWKYAWVLPTMGKSISWIPFSKFVWERFDEVERTIRKYAPHLF